MLPKYITVVLFGLVTLIPALCRADSVSVAISNRDDDAEEMGVNGNVLLTGATIDLVADNGRPQTVGLRFVNCLIPVGAIVDSAFIDFVVAAPSSGPASISVRAEASDNAPPILKDRYNISTRPLTSSVVRWSPIQPWTSVGDTMATPDLATVVQEVVVRPGWATGNSIIFICTGAGLRIAEAYEGTSPLYAARLRVYFSNMPDILVLKWAQTTSDPANGSTNPKAIPGAEILYSLVATNYGRGPTDSNSCLITDEVPSDVALFVGDLGAGGPIRFIDGAAGSGLIYTFTSLASMTDDVDFSADGGLTFNYVPVPDADGYDASVTHFRVQPQGAFAASDTINFPSFTLQFRVKTR